MASCAKWLPRLQTQYLAAGVSRRRISASCSRSAGGRGRVLAAVDRARQAQRERGRGLALEREVGQHVAHQRVLDQALAEGHAVRGVVQRQRQRAAHQARGAERAIEARQRAHREDLRQAAALVADAPGERVDELDLRAGVGLVAELVLEALDAHGVERAVGQPARQEEARRAGGRLRDHEERVAHRRRHEPLVAHQPIALAPGVAAVGHGAAWCWRARRSRPASPSCPCPSSSPSWRWRAGSAAS